MSAFGTYLVGFVLLVLGLSIGAYLLNAPPLWVVVGAIALLGIGVTAATTRARPRDPPS